MCASVAERTHCEAMCVPCVTHVVCGCTCSGQSTAMSAKFNGFCKQGHWAQIPLPQLAEELLEERLLDVAGRAALSPEALPSVAFFTFVNTQQSLNAVAFSPDSSWVIGARRARCAASMCGRLLPVASALFLAQASIHQCHCHGLVTWWPLGHGCTQGP